MGDGWLLDITEGRDGTHVVLWVKDRATRRVRPHRVAFRPPFLVEGPRELLDHVAAHLRGSPRVERVEERSGCPSLFDRRPHRFLIVTARRNSERRRLASEVDALGEYRRLTLYDVDLSAPQLYHLAHGLYPFAPVTESAGRFVATEPAEAIDYEPAPLSAARLSVELTEGRRGGVVPPGSRIARVALGPTRIEGEEAAVLDALVAELARSEPDLLVTDGGDGFDLPWLYRRAAALDLPEERFYLGREPASFRPSRPARSFETYGQVLHREAAFPLPGRFHVDRDNSFLFDDASVEGLIDAARLSRLSLQTIARQSPGTCFTAMEMAHALAEGVHVPWKKNRPERFKTARTLVEADRGGVLLTPPAGVHDQVEEFDFASLYPHLMVRHNLSTETLDCRCCPRSPEVVPGLGYRSCRRRVGLIPRTLAPLLERRLAYKARMRAPGVTSRERERLSRRVKMLKWVLVTAFGYQGYRNARFGRIECHEAINAYARELFAQLVPRAEAAGYRVLHGLVDSLWLVPTDPGRATDPEGFALRTSRETDLPLGYEGRYRWIVFLPSVQGDVAVPNRYYGLYESGEFKLRGVGSRRRDTPELLHRFEREVLNALASARDARGVGRALPKVLARADRFVERVRSGSWPRAELVITHRLAQGEEAFVTFTDTVAALRQLAGAGLPRAPGESVGYVVVDRRARSWRERVVAAELLDGDGPYDAGAYVELLARAAETLLAPLGVDRAKLLERWGAAPAPPRDRYRSPESSGQRRLATALGSVGNP